jgi:hypothetical protein
MVKNKQKNTDSRLPKILTAAATAVIVIGGIANLYSAYINQRFIHDPISLLYYLRYFILIGGGFAAGYLLVKKPTTNARYTKLSNGVFYAILAVTLFCFLDALRASLQPLFDLPVLPWGELLFEITPPLSVVIVLLIAYFSQYKSHRSYLSRHAKIALIVSFIGYQVYFLGSQAYSLMTGAASYDPAAHIWSILGGYLVTPIIVTIAAYLVLCTMTKQFDKLFYATLIGALYSTLTLLLWEFRTDPSLESTNIFSGIVTAITLVFVAILTWRVRTAVK